MVMTRNQKKNQLNDNNTVNSSCRTENISNVNKQNIITTYTTTNFKYKW